MFVMNVVLYFTCIIRLNNIKAQHSKEKPQKVLQSGLEVSLRNYILNRK